MKLSTREIILEHTIDALRELLQNIENIPYREVRVGMSSMPEDYTLFLEESLLDSVWGVSI